MSSDSSLLDTPEVHWPVLRQETPMESPPAPTSTLTPTVCSRPSTMSPTPSTDSRSPAPTSQLDQLPQRLHPLLPQPSTQNLSLPQSLTELPQSQSKTPHAIALEAAAAAASERKRRDADEEAAPAVAALPLASGLPLTYAAAAPVAAGLPLTYAAAALPAAAAVAHAPVVKSVVEKPAEVATEIAAHPVISYAAAPFAAPFYGKRSADEAAAAPAPAALPLGLPYAGLPLTYAGYPYAAGLPVAAPVATPLAAAAPSREAVLTTIKLNPGHAVAYRVD